MWRATRKPETSRSLCVTLAQRSSCLSKTMGLVLSRPVFRTAATSQLRWACGAWKNARSLLLDGWILFQRNLWVRKSERAFPLFTQATEVTSHLGGRVQSPN